MCVFSPGIAPVSVWLMPSRAGGCRNGPPSIRDPISYVAHTHWTLFADSFLSSQHLAGKALSHQELSPFHSSAKQFNWLQPVSETILNRRNPSCCLRPQATLGPTKLRWESCKLTGLCLEVQRVKLPGHCAGNNVDCAALPFLGGAPTLLFV